MSGGESGCKSVTALSIARLPPGLSRIAGVKLARDATSRCHVVGRSSGNRGSVVFMSSGTGCPLNPVFRGTPDPGITEAPPARNAPTKAKW